MDVSFVLLVAETFNMFCLYKIMGEPVNKQTTNKRTNVAACCHRVTDW